jgi:hypothetical protein
MAKLPFVKFFPNDWRAETSVQLSSLSARGLWLEMLLIMHRAEPRGHLLVDGNPVEPPELARLVGAPLAEVEQGLSELERRGVFSRNRAGVIVSRRMVREEKLSSKQRDNVEKRWRKPQKPDPEQTTENKEQSDFGNTKPIPNGYQTDTHQRFRGSEVQNKASSEPSEQASPSPVTVRANGEVGASSEPARARKLELDPEPERAATVIQHPNQQSWSAQAVTALRKLGVDRDKAQEAVAIWRKRFSQDDIDEAIDTAKLEDRQGGQNIIGFVGAVLRRMKREHEQVQAAERRAGKKQQRTRWSPRFGQVTYTIGERLDLPDKSYIDEDGVLYEKNLNGPGWDRYGGGC